MTQQYAIRRKSDGFIMRTHKVYNGGPCDLGQWTLTDDEEFEQWATDSYTSADSTIKGWSNYPGEYFTQVLNGDNDDYEIVKVVTMYEVME